MLAIAGSRFVRGSLSLVVALALLTQIAGCATTEGHNKAVAGVGAGAVIGAILGAAVGGEDGAAIGVLIGAAAGGAIGAKLDADDERKRQAALGIAATQAPGSYASWASPEKGTSGQVARVGDLFVAGGKQCMVVEETLSIKGKPQTVKDTRCQDASGQWLQAAS